MERDRTKYEKFLGTCFLTGILFTLCGLFVSTIYSDFNVITKSGLSLLIIPFIFASVVTLIRDTVKDNNNSENN